MSGTISAKDDSNIDHVEGKNIEERVFTGSGALAEAAILEHVNPVSKRLLQLYMILGIMFDFHGTWFRRQLDGNHSSDPFFPRQFRYG